jgi:hypothetical protein
MKLIIMKKSILVLGLVTGIFTSSVYAQSKAIKAINQTKEAIAHVVNIDPIDVVAGYVTKQKEVVTEFYAANELNLETSYPTADSGARKTDTTEIKVGKTRIVVIGEAKIEKIYMEKDSTGDYEADKQSSKNEECFGDNKKHEGGIEFSIGYNGLLENGSTSLSPANQGLNLVNGKSTNVNLTYNHYFNIYKENVRLSVGLGLDWNNYRLAGDSSLRSNAPKFTMYQDSTNGKAIDFTKNKLLARYATLPVMLHFQSNELNNGKRIGVSGGIELGYLINGRLKQISEEKGKTKVNDSFNLNELRYGFMGRVHYGNVGIYGKYYPQSAFNSNEGPDLNTFCVGLTFGINE